MWRISKVCEQQAPLPPPLGADRSSQVARLKARNSIGFGDEYLRIECVGPRGVCDAGFGGPSAEASLAPDGLLRGHPSFGPHHRLLPSPSLTPSRLQAPRERPPPAPRS